MFKKSCLAACLLASAASASNDWNGKFEMADGPTICRTPAGLFIEGRKPQPTLDLSAISSTKDEGVYPFKLKMVSEVVGSYH